MKKETMTWIGLCVGLALALSTVTVVLFDYTDQHTNGRRGTNSIKNITAITGSEKIEFKILTEKLLTCREAMETLNLAVIEESGNTLIPECQVVSDKLVTIKYKKWNYAF